MQIFERLQTSFVNILRMLYEIVIIVSSRISVTCNSDGTSRKKELKSSNFRGFDLSKFPGRRKFETRELCTKAQLHSPWSPCTWWSKSEEIGIDGLTSSYVV